MKFTLNENGVLNHVIDWKSVHCMDQHGIFPSSDWVLKCSGYDPGKW